MFLAFWKTKVRSSFILLAVLMWVTNSTAAVPGDKRTLLTAGEKVHTIKYQLGQSTILYFGIRPETIICGNKNYFNIEKIKDAVTIQPLSNFSTNLTIMAQGRRYLFYLTPAGAARPDGFVEVKWVPASELRAVKPLAVRGTEVVRQIGKQISLKSNIELFISQEHVSDGGKRRIFDLGLKNDGRKPFSTKTVEIVASIRGQPVPRQMLIWEKDTIEKKETVRGRIIIYDIPAKSLSLIVDALGKTTNIILK